MNIGVKFDLFFPKINKFSLNKFEKNIIRKVFGSSTMDGEMGPYPLSDHTNLLGPRYTMIGNTGYCGATVFGGVNAASAVRLNYGTNNSHTSTNISSCSPMPTRRSMPKRDSFRRHSAHGRIVSSSGTFIIH